MYNLLSDYYRTALNSAVVCPNGKQKLESGFFHYGRDIVCYGQCSTGVASDLAGAIHFNASQATRAANGEIHLPFDMSKIIDTLRLEHYVKYLNQGQGRFTELVSVRDAYYSIREELPVWVRRYLQRAYLRNWRTLPFPRWPVDFTVDSLHEEYLRLAILAQGCDRIPFVWFWPNGASGCLIMTHDVESVAGRDFTSTLMDIDLEYGFKSSFQVIPEKRYEIPDSYVSEIRERGFEFNIHDLNHDSHLYDEKSEFLRRAKKINEYAAKYGARGFRSGALYRNQDWYDAYDFSYDMSVPNVAHLEPQRGGCCTVMPYFVGKILELPLTATQDYSIFHILKESTIDLWKQQVASIQQKNGLLSFIAHPDYLIAPKYRKIYESLLAYLRQIVDREDIWAALPGEVDRWWRARREMKLVEDGKGYRIEGPGSECAHIAYASLDGDRVVYTLDEAHQ
ncbi:MAG: hypothetical protein WAK48_10705 [Candidatus Acidiferrum sp.]|jgi:hypothetical protein